MNQANEHWQLEIRNRYPNDRFLYEVFEQQIYGEARDQNPKVVIDAGARFGEFSFYIYDKANQIYAIEPESRNFGELKFNVELHKLNKIKYFELALSDTNGTSPLRIAGDNGGHALVTGQTQDFIIVPTKTLNTFLEENKIESVDVLKIDIESAEDLVFSAPDIDEAMKKIKFIIGEHGDLDLITKHGFEIERISTGWVARRPQ